MATMSRSDRRRPPRVRAVQEQMLDASGFQLALMFPQSGYDCGLVHGAILFAFSRISVGPESATAQE